MKKKGSRGAFTPTADEVDASSHLYGWEFQMIYGVNDVDEACNDSEKKRRLSVDQVTALEKDFEVENKLEPDRKVKLARELGLQPRQVAVWFQNRRARWKTKQLERDYGLLKANLESLRANYDAVQQLNDALRVEINELKAKLNEDKAGVVVSVKGEVVPYEFVTLSETTSHVDMVAAQPMVLDVKDGSSDSDSSAILNDEAQHLSPIYPCHGGTYPTPYQAHMVKLEESYTCEEACNLFSDEQPPTLPWYSPTSGVYNT